jgi:hypothetical protein
MRAAAHVQTPYSERPGPSGLDVRATVFWRLCCRSNSAVLKDNCRAARRENFARWQNLRRGRAHPGPARVVRQYLFDLPKQLLRCLPRGHEPMFGDVRIGQR